jgi:hypothetical protein
MMWIKILLLLLFVFTAQSVEEDIRSVQMSIMTGWQFQCINTTCIPFVTLTASSVRTCQISCLGQIQCEAASFQQSNSICQLFTNIPNPDSNLLADLMTITMIVMPGTRIPPG